MESVELERYYLGCLAHASYMVGSGGVAAVIDPQRDVDLYLEAAAQKGWKIEHIIETHVHADFVSGHSELAGRTGAKIYLGEGSGASFDHVVVKDGDEIAFGDCRMHFLQTPGHTVESICVVMTDASRPEKPAIVFTGDTLFVGDVGRPDLAPNMTPQQLAGSLYDSLHQKLLTLPDETEIYPAHGAGSLCGRNMSAESSSTIGKQRQTNYALRARSREEFVHLLTDNLNAAPEYFKKEVELNRKGATALRELAELQALNAGDVQRMQGEGAVVVDTRQTEQFAEGHVPGSIHIALTGQYASWAARILGLNTPLILVGEDADHVRESRLRLARVGIEKVVGFVDGGAPGWEKDGRALATMPQMTHTELAELLSEGKEPVTVLDVREAGEVEIGAIENAVKIPLGKLQQNLAALDRDDLIVVLCRTGYRSSIASSILRRAGFRGVANLTGGIDGWKAAGLPMSIPTVAHA
jgi:hydroxyacylglutathione hydrolase